MRKFYRTSLGKKKSRIASNLIFVVLLLGSFCGFSIFVAGFSLLLATLLIIVSPSSTLQAMPGGSVVLYTAFKNGGTVRSFAGGLETRNMEVRHQRPNNSALFSVAVIVTVFSVFLSSLHREST